MNHQISESVIRNGINTEILGHYISLMGKESQAGVVSAQLRHKWKNGFAVKGSVEKMKDAGEELIRTHHSFKTDWPEPFSGDSGPTPGLEMLLSCAGACAATSFAVKASLAGIEIKELEVITEGKVDLKGLFEVDDDTPARLQDLSITFNLDSDADDITIQKLMKNLYRTSPVLDSIVNSVSVELSTKRM